MTELSPRQVFISYSRRDGDVTQRIVSLLRKQGFDVWLDNEKLIPGTPIWETEIETAIKRASAIVVILSPDSKNSEWVRREISLADQYRKRVFPVLVRGDEESSISLRLINRQYVDIRENESVRMGSLVNALLGYIQELNPQESAIQTESLNVQNTTREISNSQTNKVKTIEANARGSDSAKPNTSLLTDTQKAFLLSWKGRSLLGIMVGLILGILYGVLYGIIHDISYDFAYAYLSFSDDVPHIFLLVTCGLAGLIAYPHKFSVILMITGFFVAAIIITGPDWVPWYDDNPTVDIITSGGLFGIPVGALISRILGESNKLGWQHQ